MGSGLLQQRARAVAQVLPEVCKHICPPIGSEHDGFQRNLPLHTPQALRHQSVAVTPHRICANTRFGASAPSQVFVNFPLASALP